MQYQRLISLDQTTSSVLLFGPRMTGKTSLLKTLKANLFINLLDRKLELSYRNSPELFWQQVSSQVPKSLIIVDEIQKIPELLDYVQMAIDDYGHRFLLSGSSARKLKRSGANLLGGRAIETHLYPLSYMEIGNQFSLDQALRFGTLPKISMLMKDNAVEEVKDILESYCTLYIKDEIQAEALTRNISSFSRFLQIAGQSHGHIIEYANISDASKVPATTVKEYFSILEDTLIGSFIWPWDRSERKKARPKFYFFDPGVLRGLQNQLNDPPTGQETGLLFEGWFIYEVKKINSYFRKRLTIELWRSNDFEIDLLVRNGRGEGLAIEIKSGVVSPLSETMIKKFKTDFPKIEILIASRTDTLPRKLESGTRVLPWRDVLDMVKNL
jgi:predicted AAA+ superfamily ATPase